MVCCRCILARHQLVIDIWMLFVFVLWKTVIGVGVWLPVNQECLDVYVTQQRTNQ